jgi:hypothetical protein
MITEEGTPKYDEGISNAKNRNLGSEPCLKCTSLCTRQLQRSRQACSSVDILLTNVYSPIKCGKSRQVHM